MSSILGYFFGKSNEAPTNSNIGTNDEKIREKELADDWIVVQESKPQSPVNEDEFEKMEQSVVWSNVEFTPTLSSSQMDEQTKLRFRLFLQEQHQHHILHNNNQTEPSNQRPPIQLPSHPRIQEQAGTNDDMESPRNVEAHNAAEVLRVEQFVEVVANNNSFSRKMSRKIQFAQAESKSKSPIPKTITINRKDQGSFPRNCSREIKGFSNRVGKGRR